MKWRSALPQVRKNICNKKQLCLTESDKAKQEDMNEHHFTIRRKRQAFVASFQ